MNIKVSIAIFILLSFFNIGAVLGITGMINPIEIPNFFSKYLFDNTMMIFVSLILLVSILPLYKASITRLKGAALIAIYGGYIYLLF